uniref:Transmembrane protein n=1 Tax=Cyprinus carpio TaxID=7962 RepID=A0A8C2EGW5_CYPCA
MPHFLSTISISEEKQKYFSSKNTSIFFLIIQAVTMASLQCLIVLCMLHLCVQNIQGQVIPAALANMIQYFDNNVQPKTKIGTNAQYAIAISVPQDLCTNQQSHIENVFSREEAQYVKDFITEGQTCVRCSASQNVIATRPNVVTDEHSEHVLLFPPGNSPLDTLLKNTDQNNCVVFYSYNSPCVKKCIKSADNIFPGLENWNKVREGGMNVFVFGNLWKDAKKEIGNDFLMISKLVPLYRCKSTNVMECQNCVNGNTPNDFCLPDNTSILLYFQEMLLSMIELFLS